MQARRTILADELRLGQKPYKFKHALCHLGRSCQLQLRVSISGCPGATRLRLFHRNAHTPPCAYTLLLWLLLLGWCCAGCHATGSAWSGVLVLVVVRSGTARGVRKQGCVRHAHAVYSVGRLFWMLVAADGHLRDAHAAPRQAVTQSAQVSMRLVHCIPSLPKERLSCSMLLMFCSRCGPCNTMMQASMADISSSP